MRASTTTFISAVAALTGSAAAQTVIPPLLGFFTLETFVPTEPGSAITVGTPVNANDGQFFIRKGTNATCADGAASCCPSNSRTSFVVGSNTLQDDGTSGSTPWYLNTEGFSSGARQQVYCSTTDGALRFTPAGDLPPYDAGEYANITYTPEKTRRDFGSVANVNTDWVLCPTADGYQRIGCKALTPEGANCTDATLATRPDFLGVAAGVYQ